VGVAGYSAEANQVFGAIFGEAAVGYCLAFEIGLEASIRFRIGHSLKRQSILNVLCQQIQGHCCNSRGASRAATSAADIGSRAVPTTRSRARSFPHQASYIADRWSSCCHGHAQPQRRRNNDPHRESWGIYYDDVRVGTIGKRAGVPVEVDQWGWSCGFYPGLDPAQYRSGSAQTFDQARVHFVAAWANLLSHVPIGAFDATVSTEQRSGPFTPAAKGCRARHPSSLMRCVCGVTFDSHKPAESYDHRLHIYAAQANTASWTNSLSRALYADPKPPRARSSSSPMITSPIWTAAF
jgi:hypothetical protein